MLYTNIIIIIFLNCQYCYQIQFQIAQFSGKPCPHTPLDLNLHIAEVWKPVTKIPGATLDYLTVIFNRFLQFSCLQFLWLSINYWNHYQIHMYLLYVSDNLIFLKSLGLTLKNEASLTEMTEISESNVSQHMNKHYKNCYWIKTFHNLKLIQILLLAW